MIFTRNNCGLQILKRSAGEMNIKTLIRYHEGYDHSYYFVSSFIGEHIAYHANKLNMR